MAAEAVRRVFPEVMVHRHPTNLGIASGRNAAVKLAFNELHPTHLLFLDNDILVEPSFVAGLLQPSLKDSRVGQTQAKLRFMDERDRLNDGGGAQINFITWKATPVGYGGVDHGQYDHVTQCISCGGATMVRTDVFHRPGGFDEIFSRSGPEDMTFCSACKTPVIGTYVCLGLWLTIWLVVLSVRGTAKNMLVMRQGHWFAFIRRHATPIQKAGFFLIGLPIIDRSSRH